MVNHKLAIEILKSRIDDIQERIDFLENGDTFEYTKEAKQNDINIIDNLQGSIAMLTTFINEPLRLKNNTLRLKATKHKDKIDIKIIEKEGKQYAVVPLEILPKNITF